jgi:RHS repeat-associated protein
VVTSEKRYLWAEGAQPAEERAADGRTVLKQYHAQGEFLPGAVAPLNKVFYTKDHLGSVRELVDGNGTLQTCYDYDLWGGRTKLSGTVESEVGYTGHHHHGKSGLVLTWYRAFDPVTGRWLSRDPIGEEGGINLYGYVSNNPVNAMDPHGLDAVPAPGGGYNFVMRPGLNPNNLNGSTITNSNPNYSGQCATGAQFLAGTRVGNQIHDAPSTSTWTPGAPVGANTPSGTMIATGWVNGGYPSRPASSYGPGETINHTGIFQGMNKDGTMNISDQSCGRPIATHPISPNGWNAVTSPQPYDPRPSTSAATPSR